MVLQVSLSSSSLAVTPTEISGVGGTPVGAWVTVGAWVAAGAVPPAVGLGGAGLLAAGAAGCESAIGLNPGWLVSLVGGVTGVLMLRGKGDVFSEGGGGWA